MPLTDDLRLTPRALSVKRPAMPAPVTIGQPMYPSDAASAGTPIGDAYAAQAQRFYQGRMGMPPSPYGSFGAPTGTPPIPLRVAPAGTPPIPLPGMPGADRAGFPLMPPAPPRLEDPGALAQRAMEDYSRTHLVRGAERRRIGKQAQESAARRNQLRQAEFARQQREYETQRAIAEKRATQERDLTARKEIAQIGATGRADVAEAQAKARQAASDDAYARQQKRDQDLGLVVGSDEWKKRHDKDYEMQQKALDMEYGKKAGLQEKKQVEARKWKIWEVETEFRRRALADAFRNTALWATMSDKEKKELMTMPTPPTFDAVSNEATEEVSGDLPPPFQPSMPHPLASTEKPPMEGAVKAPDGKWYVQKDGKWNLVNL